jgi:hypothetical protein
MLRDFLPGFVCIYILHRPSRESAYGLWLIEERELSLGTLHSYFTMYLLEKQQIRTEYSKNIKKHKHSIKKYYRIADKSSEMLPIKRTFISSCIYPNSHSIVRFADNLSEE